MIVLGIPLRLPGKKELPPLVTIWLVLFAVFWSLMHFQVLEAQMAFSFLIATMAGSLASGMGLSVAQHGWRAVVIIFVLGLFLWFPQKLLVSLFM